MSLAHGEEGRGETVATGHHYGCPRVPSSSGTNSRGVKPTRNLWGSLRNAHMGSPVAKTGTVLRAGTEPSLSIPAWM